ncbi:alpha/beta fold hydrolase [Helicobacter kayseriensis]|uniref:alpha/beta fold hydrolase n=1 Tax=Helicobacter kayseriensis TaxID=2905877 RepID=UPI001E39FF67|nr:alpha/beta fold hydrolase [Helicobacter kayseriensis]MCE3047824.1 DUF2974 domain-containing protein [Helicobacter kayseriensis]MCE3049188.1 DUF2974 domain-containing protein [Helicobacter kayseriensis]
MKEQITKIKDYANVADASYALLHYIEENEEFKASDDEWEVQHRKEPPARWIYADGIKRGYELTRENTKNTKIQELLQSNQRSLGQPTAYALAIEARFAKDQFITINHKKKKIDNKIQNLIERKKDKPALEYQKIKVSTTKEKIKKEETSRSLSARTKAFVSRYEVIEHQKNTAYGFSATLFKDHENNNELILVCRGTEYTKEDFQTDIALAQGDIPLQCYDLARFYEEKVKHHLREEEKLLLIGHSLGGYLAQSFCLMYPHKVKELYTFNSPGVLNDWSKKFVKGDESSKIESSQWLLRWLEEKLSIASKLNTISLTFNLYHNTAIPKELEKYEFLIQKINDHLSITRNNPDFIPPPLKDANILHIETTNTLDTQEHLKTWLIENTTQHLGKDIKGDYLFLYVSEEGLDSHYLNCTLQTLSFYEYLLALSSNEAIFLKEGLQETFDALNTYHQNLSDYFSSFIGRIEGYKRRKESERMRTRGPKTPPLSEKLQAFYLEIAQKGKQTPLGILLGLYLDSLKKVSYENKTTLNELSQSKDLLEILSFLKERFYFLRSFDDQSLKEHQTNLQKAQDEAALRVALSTFALFVLVNQDNQPLLSQKDFFTLFGYNTPEIIAALSHWDGEYLAFQAKTTRALYFGGSVVIGA